MNLRIFFDPVSSAPFKGNEDPSLLINNIRIYDESFPDWSEADIAIIGLTEDRGTLINKGLQDGPDEIKKKLYGLKKGTGDYKIVDLGNMRNGVTLEETYLRMKEIGSTLMQHNTLPLFIGGSHDLDYGQFLAYEQEEKMISFLNIDASVDMQGSAEDMSSHHIHRILVHEPNIIFHYSHLAYQSFLVDSETVSVLEKLYFETCRIGQMRENLEETEPIIRNSDMMSFDISSIRQSDAPGNMKAQAFGLTGEEACQLCWYAGLNPRMSSAGFYEYNPSLDNRGQTASVIATMIWYFVEGYYSRRADVDLSDPQYVKYIVSLPSDPHKLVFYKSSSTDKWWMEVPYATGKSKYARNSIVPCSYNDYQAANRGEIPNRWILTQAKLI